MKSRTPNTTSKPMMKITTTIHSATLSILGSHAVCTDGLDRHHRLPGMADHHVPARPPSRAVPGPTPKRKAHAPYGRFGKEARLCARRSFSFTSTGVPQESSVGGGSVQLMSRSTRMTSLPMRAA